MNLGQWLRKTPQPTAIDVDGKKVAIGSGGGKWRDAVRTIETLKGEKITALDSSGNVIRAFTIEDEEEKPPAAPQQSDIQVFAGLIAAAYEKGHTAQQPVINNALQFVERLSARLAAAEREIDRLRHENLRLRGEVLEISAEAAAGESKDDTLIGALVQGAAAAAMGGGPPNGASATTPSKRGVKP